MSPRQCLIQLLSICLLATPALGQLPIPAPVCPAVPADVEPRRSLFVTDLEILQHFELEQVMNQLARQSRVPGLQAIDLWSQWWNTQNPAGPGVGPGPHCDDQVDQAGNETLNGFPYQCPRAEGGEASVDPFDPDPLNEAFYKPVALVNRFDLAPPDGANCGEYRMIFARVSGETDPLARNLIIFEAVLPNPSPGCGLEGCRKVAEFWARLSDVDDPARRARMLARFYFRGLPRAGSAPVIRIEHFAPGTGQIRSNQFMQFNWMLREFKLAHQCTDSVPSRCSLQVVPVTDKTNPFGELFDDNSPGRRARRFQRFFLTQIPSLLPDDVNAFSNFIPNRFNTGQSQSQGNENDYPFHLNPTGTFGTNITRVLNRLQSPLSPVHIARRSMAMSCAGCHELSTSAPDNDLGPGIVWPDSLGFTHVSESSTEVLPDGTLGFMISPALTDEFLPHRERVFERFLRHPPCRGDDCPGIAAITSASGPGPIVVLHSDARGEPLPLTSAEVEALDALLKQGQSRETLGGPRRSH